MIYNDQLESIKKSLENEVEEETIINRIVDEFLENHCTQIKVYFDCGDDREYFQFQYREDDIQKAIDAANLAIEEVKKELLTLN